MDPGKRRERIAGLVQEIEEEAAVARERNSVQPAGADAILAHHPHTRPERLKKGPAPLFHTATAEMRQLLWGFYAEFVGKFRDAAEKLRAGDLGAVFPPGLLSSGLAVRAWVGGQSFRDRSPKLDEFAFPERTGQEKCGLSVEEAVRIPKLVLGGHLPTRRPSLRGCHFPPDRLSARLLPSRLAVRAWVSG